MTESLPFILIAIIGVSIIAIIILNFIAAAKRREHLLLLATRRSLEFSQDDPFDIHNMYFHFSHLSQGHNRRASNVLYGRLGDYDAKAFDYRYETGSGKSHSVHNLSVIILDTDVHFPNLLIRPEGFSDRVAEAFGFDDIDFESDQFSRRFFVKSENKKFAYDVIHQRMMDYLMENRGWTICMSERSVMITNMRTLRAEDFDKAMDFALGFMGYLPDYLWQKLRDTQEV